MVRPMEAFESFVAVALESEDYVVSSAVKFRVPRRTKKAAYEEWQEHGYEVDLIGARADRLVLATVKSFFGSVGVRAEHVDGTTKDDRWRKSYALLNDEGLRTERVKKAAARYGYNVDQVELRLCVGRFAAPVTRTHEDRIRTWADTQIIGAGPIKVFGLDEVVGDVRDAAEHKQYRDDPVPVTMKVLAAAKILKDSP
jgi:hypothetical protein